MCKTKLTPHTHTKTHTKTQTHTQSTTPLTKDGPDSRTSGTKQENKYKSQSGSLHETPRDDLRDRAEHVRVTCNNVQPKHAQ